MTRAGKTFLLDSLAIFLLTAALVAPLFRLKYYWKWDSIESTFISDARFLRDHWPHPRWQPLWYGGTRFDYIYPPALRYGTAVLTRIHPGLAPVRAYHIYTAFFYCLGIAGVYVFARLAAGSRGAACLAAAAVALVAPTYLFMASIREDAEFRTPLRLWALVRYGEGPHMTALALLPVALAAAFRALEQWRPRALALAAVLSALVVSHNFYGGVALAVLFPILVWALWITNGDRRIWLRALGIAALAYGLAAFWLVPSYFRITVHNLQYVAEPGQAWSRWAALAVAAAFAWASYRWARGRRERAYLVFVWGASVVAVLIVLGHYYWNFRVAGEPGRWTPEMDLVLILLAVEALRRLWARGPAARACAAVATLVCLSATHPYLRQPWAIYIRDWEPQRRFEYRLNEWMAKNLPEARTLATGSVRFWYDTWHDLAQIDGGSDQGVLNPTVMPAQFQLLYGKDAATSLHWMLALGIDAAIVHGPESKEEHHDYQYPEKFAGVLRRVYDDGEGNRIYQAPRRFPGLARVVEKARAESLLPIRDPDDTERVRSYSELVEKGPDAPTVSRWEGTDALRIRATLHPGEALLALVSYDPAWRAYSEGRRLPIRKDVMGQMLIDAPPGEHDLRLVFETPLENLMGRVASGLSAILVFGLMAWRVKV